MAKEQKEELAASPPKKQKHYMDPKNINRKGRPLKGTEKHTGVNVLRVSRASLKKRIKVLEEIAYNPKSENKDKLQAIKLLTDILGDKVTLNESLGIQKITQKLEEITKRTNIQNYNTVQEKPITQPIKEDISKIASKSDVFEADFLDNNLNETYPETHNPLQTNDLQNIKKLNETHETLDNTPINTINDSFLDEDVIKESENVIKPNNSPIKDNENIIGANNSPIKDINDTIKLCADENSVMDNVIKANENTINNSADVIKEEPNTIKPNDSTIKDNDSPIKEEIIELFFEVKVDDDKSNDPFLTEEE